MNIEDLLREAAPGANDLFLSELPGPKDCHYTVSKRFERKMKKLLKRQKSPVLYWVQRSVACFLLVILLGSATVLTFSAEARAAFFGWVREVYETWTSYLYIGHEQEIDTEDTIYEPQWIPDGYIQTVPPEDGESVFCIYENSEGLPLVFAYTKGQTSAGLFIKQDDHDIKDTTVGKTPAELYLNHNEDDADTLVWIDKDRNIVCWITAHLSEAELIKIAENIG